MLMIQDSILVCSPDPRIPHTAVVWMSFLACNLDCFCGHIVLSIGLIFGGTIRKFIEWNLGLGS
jgi:hypothetical protein